MLRMILIQLWNERKANVMLFLELMVVSVFLWYAADALYVSYKEYARPMGFTGAFVGMACQDLRDHKKTADFLSFRYENKEEEA